VGSEAKRAGPERRRHPRFQPDRFRFTLRKKGLLGAIGGGPNLGLGLADLSEGGAQVVCSQELKRGAAVKFSITIEKFGDTVEADGIVQWVQSVSGERWRCGLLFGDLTPDARRKLANNASWFTSEMYHAKRRQQEREKLGFA
jgi:hypothetical protein